MINKQLNNHKDKLGRPLVEGACVAISVDNSLLIATVKKLHPKMVKVIPIGNYRRGYNKYPHDMIIIDGPEVSMFLLKNSG